MAKKKKVCFEDQAKAIIQNTAKKGTKKRGEVEVKFLVNTRLGGTYYTKDHVYYMKNMDGLDGLAVKI